MQKSKKENTIDNLNAICGKIPPQSIELEKAVLGALLISNDAIYNITDILNSDSFYLTEHQHIFSAIVKIANSNGKIDIITVANQLKFDEKLDSIGGEIYLSELTDRVATSSHIEFHARLIQQKYIQRRLIMMGASVQSKAFDEMADVEELIEYAEAELYKISDHSIKQELQTSSSLIVQSLDKLEERSRQKDAISGISSGFRSVDKITEGWQSPDLIIIAARPAMGKTAFALGLARNAAIDDNKKVAVFSLEMSSLQLSDRLLCSESEIISEKIRSGQLAPQDWQFIEKAAAILDTNNLLIDDTPAISLFELRAKCRRLKRKSGLDMVVVDYLQLMTTGSDMKGQREQEVSYISRGLKSLAKELNIPIIALSQLNRSVESRGGNKRPQLSDLRESGAIEQDADMVVFIHRPEYYGILEDEEGVSTRGMAEIIFAKYRNGGVGTVELGFKPQIVKFHELRSSDDENSNNQTKAENNSDIPTNYDFDTADFSSKDPLLTTFDLERTKHDDDLPF